MAELTIGEIKTQIQSWVKDLAIIEAERLIDEASNRLRVKHAVFEKDSPGVWSIQIPERAESLTISASAGGGSGEGLVDYNKYGSDGEPTIVELYRKNNSLIKRISLEQGFSGENASGNGTDTAEGKGGIPSSSEDANRSSGERRGAGGCGAGFMDYEAWGGGAGEEIISYVPTEMPAKIVFTIGKGGDVNDLSLPGEDDVSMKTCPGNGADGFARVDYLIGTLKTFNEEGVRDFNQGR